MALSYKTVGHHVPLFPPLACSRKRLTIGQRISPTTTTRVRSKSTTELYHKSASPPLRTPSARRHWIHLASADPGYFHVIYKLASAPLHSVFHHDRGPAFCHCSRADRFTSVRSLEQNVQPRSCSPQKQQQSKAGTRREGSIAVVHEAENRSGRFLKINKDKNLHHVAAQASGARR